MDEDADFEALLEFLKESRGFDFTGYKRPSLLRRIRNRMQTVGIEEFDRYADHLQADPEEFVELFNTILINVTSFFRDSPVWSYLAEEVVPKIVEEAGDGPIRVWCAACASGEETYSIAMLLAEATGKEAFLQRVKIYGTDVDEEALKQARQGVYSEKAVDAVPLEMRKKYFKRQNDRFMFDNELRRALIFGRHDLVKDVPISRIDLLLCRNVLMYFNSDSQTRVMSRLNFALKEGGFIVLGKAEMLSTQFTSLAPVDLKRRLFSKTTKGTPRENLLLLTQAGDQGAAGQLREHVAGREEAFES